MSQKLHVDVTLIIIGEWGKFHGKELKNLLLYVYTCIALSFVSLRSSFVALGSNGNIILKQMLQKQAVNNTQVFQTVSLKQQHSASPT